MLPVEFRMSSIKHAPCPCCRRRRDAALRGPDLKAPTGARPARFVIGAAGDQPSRPSRAPLANEIILCAHRVISVPRSRTRSDALRDDSGAHAGIGSMHARPHCQLSLLTAVSTFPSTPKPASGEPDLRSFANAKSCRSGSKPAAAQCRRCDVHRSSFSKRLASVQGTRFRTGD